MAKETMMDTMEAVIEGLARQKYVADRSIGMAVYLALRMEKPLLVEGEPGCGKTEIARTLAAALGSDLIRLQCYEGLDADATLYEWNHPKQLLTIRIEEARKDPKALERQIFSEEFLLKRPLLQALTHEGERPPVLLIDEIDRADEEFEGLLLEFLSDFQITIPEIGTIRAKRAPRVVITSNRTRELSDALKRRCLYLYIGYPTREKEISILRRKVPELGEQFANEITGFVQQVRAQDDFVKRPGISETLEWASALIVLRTAKLDRDIVEQTLGLLIKDAQDLQTMQSGRLDSILGTP
ncbi:MAG TPA: MoxR family ATPase [Thermoplasmata archaeon]|nr:MoxR family ATPase [Thermoplasmata archaeon]